MKVIPLSVPAPDCIPVISVEGWQASNGSREIQSCIPIDQSYDNSSRITP
jgi:hypothetical protein